MSCITPKKHCVWFICCVCRVQFTLLNNALQAEISWSCFLVVFYRRKSHETSEAVFGHDTQLKKSIQMFGLLFIILTLTL